MTLFDLRFRVLVAHMITLLLIAQCLKMPLKSISFLHLEVSDTNHKVDLLDFSLSRGEKCGATLLRLGPDVGYQKLENCMKEAGARNRLRRFRCTLPSIVTLQLCVHFSLIVLVHLANSQVKKHVLTTAWHPRALNLSRDLGHELSLPGLGVAIAAEQYLSALSALVQHEAGFCLGQSRQATQLGVGFSFFEMTHLIREGSATLSAC